MAGVSAVRVVIVDDDPMVRAGLRMILQGAPDIDVVAEAGDGRDAIDVVERELPDVVLMDLRMPRMDGLTAIRRLRERGSTTHILVLTTFDTDELILTALQYGAGGFLLKDIPPADLVAAVRRAARGEPMLSPRITSKLIEAATRPVDLTRQRTATTLLARLTERERAVAEAVAEGLTNAEIADLLHLGVATVKTHVSSIFLKLEVSNRVQVARYVHDAAAGRRPPPP